MRAARHVSASLVATIVLLAGVASAAPVQAASRPDAIIIGDSLTYRGTPDLLARQPSWVVDAMRGRRVGALPRRIKVDVAAHGIPRNLVLALGQNPTAGWTRADYAAATRLVPSRTQVFFVTTYRDPAVFGQPAADQQKTYSRWMRSIAAHRANVHVLDWRRLVLDGSAVLVDGSHPDEPSRQVWADLIVDGVAEVTARPRAAAPAA